MHACMPNVYTYHTIHAFSSPPYILFLAENCMVQLAKNNFRGMEKKKSFILCVSSSTLKVTEEKEQYTALIECIDLNLPFLSLKQDTGLAEVIV